MPTENLMEPLRITIQIPSFIARKLICWSKAHGKPKATFASQIISARVEANVETIDKLMQDIAAYEGVSAKELEIRWLEEENFEQEEE